MKFLKNKHFWGGFVTGVIVGPWVLSRVMPGVKARIPNGG